MSCHILFVMTQAPYGNSLAKESLDALLASGVFEQEVSALFTGDGVWQLIKDQQMPANNQLLIWQKATPTNCLS